MFYPGTHIPSDMCSPTQKTHSPSDMCSPTQKTHSLNDMCSPTQETQVNKNDVNKGT